MKKQDLSSAHDALKEMEKQLKESKTKLTQELNKANNDLRKAQSDIDKTQINYERVEANLKKTEQKVSQMELLHQTHEKNAAELNRFLKEVSKERDNLVCKLECCENKLRTSQQKQEELQRDLKTLQNSANFSTQELLKKESEVLELRQKFEKMSKSHENNAEALKMKLCELEKKKSRADGLLQQKDSEVSQLNAKLCKMESSSNELAQKLEKCQKECAALSQENSMLIEQGEETVMLLKKAKCDYEQLKKKHDADIRESARNFKDEINQWQKKLDENCESSQQQLDALLKEHVLEKENLTKQIKRQEESIKDLSGQLAQKMELLICINQKIDQLTSANEEIKRTSDLLLEEKRMLIEQDEKKNFLINGLQQKLENALQDFASSMEAHSCLEEKHAALIEEARADLIERKSLEGRVEDLEAQVETLKNSETSSSHLKNELDVSKHQLKETQDKLCNTELQLQEYINKVHALQQENSAFQENLHATAIENEMTALALNELKKSFEVHTTSYNADLDTKSRDITALQKSNEDLLTQKEDALKELNQIKSNLVTVEDDKADALNKITQIQTCLNQKESELMNLHSSSSGSLKICDDLRNQLQEKVEECKLIQLNLQQTKIDLCAKQDTLMEQLHKSEALTEDLNNEITSLRQSAAISSDQEEQHKKLLDERSKELDTLKSQTESLLEEKCDEIAKLSDENRSLVLQVSQLSTCFEEATSRNDTLAGEVVTLLSKISSLEDMLKTESFKHHMFAEEAEKSLKDLAYNNNELKSEVESLKLSLEDINTEKNVAYDLADSRLDTIRKLQDEVESAVKEVDGLKNALVEFHKKSADDKVIIDEQNTKIEFLQQTLQQKDVDYHKSLGECNSAKQALNDLEREHHETVKSWQAQKSTLHDAAEKVIMLEQALVGKEKEMEVISNDHSETQSLLQAKLSCLSEENCLLNTQVTELTAELDYRNEQAKKAALDNQKLGQKCEDLQIDLNKVSGNFELLQMDIEDKDIAMNKLEEVVMPNLEQTILQLQEDLEKLQNTEKTSQCDIEKLTELCDTAANENTQLKQHLEDAKLLKEQQNSIIERLESQNAEISEENKSLTQKLELLEAERHEFKSLSEKNESQLKEVKILHETLQGDADKERKRSRKDSETLQEELDACRSENNSLRSDNEQMHLSLDDLLAKSENLEILCDRLTQDNGSLREETEILSRELTTASHTLIDLKNQLDLTQQELERTQESKLDQSRTLIEEVDDFHQKETSLKAEVEQLAEKLQNKDKEYEILKNEHDDLCQTNMSLKTQTDNLLEQVDQMKKEYSNNSSQIESHAADIQLLQKQLKDKEDEYKDIANQTSDVIMKQEDAISSLKMSQSSLQEELDKITTTASILEKEKLSLENALHMVEIEKENLEQALSNAEANLETVNGENIETKEKLVSAFEENSSLCSLVYDLKLQLKDIEEKSQATLTEIRSQFSCVNVQLDAATQKQSSSDAFLASKEEQISQLCEEITTCKAKQDSVMETLDVVSLEKNNLTIQVEDLLLKHSELENLAQEHHARFQDATEQHALELDALKTQHGDFVTKLEKNILTLESTNHKLLSQVNESSKKFDETLNEINELKTTHSVLTQKYDALEVYSKTLEAECDAFRCKITENITLIESLEQMKNETLRALDDQKSELCTKKQKFEEAVSMANAELKKLQHELATSENNLAVARTNLEIRDEDIESLTQELEKIKEYLLAKETALVKEQEENLQQQEELNLSKEANISLHEEVAVHKTKIVELENKSAETCTDLTNHVSLLSGQIQTLKSELKEEKSAHEKIFNEQANTISIFQDNKNALEEKITLDHMLHQKDNSDKLTEIENLKMQIEEFHTGENVPSHIRDEHEKDVHTLKMRIKHLQEDAEKHEEKLSNLYQCFETLRSKFITKEDDLLSAMEENTSKDHEISQLKEELSAVEGKLTLCSNEKDDLTLTLKERNCELVDEVNGLKYELATELDQVSKLNEDLSKLNDRIVELENSLKEKQKFLDESKDVVTSLENEKEIFRRKLEESEITVKDLADQLKCTVENLAMYQQKLGEERNVVKVELDKSNADLVVSKNTERDLNEKLDMSNDRIQDLTSELSEYGQKLKDALSVINKLQVEHKQQVDAGMVAEKETQQIRHELQLQLNEKENQILHFESLSNRNEEELKTQNETITSLKEKTFELNKLLMQADTDMEVLKSSKEELQAEMEIASLELEKIKQQCIELESEKTDVQTEKSSLLEVIFDKEKLITDLEDRIKEQEDKSVSENLHHNELINKHTDALTALKREMDEVKHENACLQSSKDEAIQENETLKERVSALLEEIDKKELTVKEYFQNISNLQEELKVEEHEISEIKAAISSKEEEILKLKCQVTELTEKMSSGEKESAKNILNLEQRCQTLEILRESTKQDLSDECNKVQTLNEKLSQLEEEETRIRVLLSDKVQLLDEKICSIQILENENDHLELKLKEADCEVDRLTQMLNLTEEKLCANASEHNHLVDVLTVQLKDKGEDLQQMQSNEKMLEKEIEMLTMQNENLSNKLSEAEQKVEETKLAIDELQNESKSINNSVETAEKEMLQVQQELERRLAEAQSDFDKMKFSCERKEDELGKKTDVVTSLQCEVEMLKEEANQSKEKTKAFESQKEETDAELRKANDDLLQMKIENENLFVEKFSLDALLVEKTNNVESLESKIQTLKDDKEQLLTEMEKLDQDRAQLDEENQELLGQRNSLCEQVDEKENHIKEIKAKTSMLEVLIADTEQTNVQMSTQLQHLNEVILQESSNYKEKISNLESDNENLLESFRDLKSAAKELKASKERLETTYSECLMKVKDLEAESESLSRENEKLQEARDKFQEKCFSLSDDLDELNSSVEDAEMALEKLTLQNQELEQKLTETETLLEETSNAMEALRVTLNDEREKLIEQEQVFACTETGNQNRIELLKQEIAHLEDQLKIRETEAMLKVQEARTEFEKLNHQQQNELKTHSAKVLNELNVLKLEIQALEIRNSSLEAEVSSSNSELEHVQKRHEDEKTAITQTSATRIQVLLQDVGKLRSDVEVYKAEKLRMQEDLQKFNSELGSFQKHEELVLQLETANARLAKDKETLKGKLQLMTTNARRKEKELLRFKASIGSSSSSLAEDSQAKKPESQMNNQFLTSAQKPVNLKSRKSREGSRRSFRIKKVSAAVKSASIPKSVDSPPKKSRASEDTSSPASPAFQVEGLPHLVKKGFTDIPLGFSSPFVMRRQQISETKQLVAAAMAKKHTGVDKDLNGNELAVHVSPPGEHLQKNGKSPKKDRMQLRSAAKSASKSPSKNIRPSGVDSAPMQTVTNSPKHLTRDSSGSRGKDGRRRSRSKMNDNKKGEDGNENEPDCKVQ
ncbi:uncharacterized protein LOC143461522 isoform X1 [Clavelina lepadiformis]|uniref:uncharacterized protein LOC143461522 isoform X1 n=1 Tax=Clavelina lepadiformis TaxID=159417 RepID=UPI0040423D0F